MYYSQSRKVKYCDVAELLNTIFVLYVCDWDMYKVQWVLRKPLDRWNFLLRCPVELMWDLIVFYKLCNWLKEVSVFSWHLIVSGLKKVHGGNLTFWNWKRHMVVQKWLGLGGKDSSRKGPSAHHCHKSSRGYGHVWNSEQKKDMEISQGPVKLCWMESSYQIQLPFLKAEKLIPSWNLLAF